MFDAFRADERGIEGLPVRLVVALVVGVATLGVLLNMVSGISGLAVTELDTQPTPEVTAPGNQTVTVAVVDVARVREVELASVGTVVARTGEQRSKFLIPVVRVDFVLVPPDTDVLGHAAGEQTGSRWRAEWMGAVRPSESSARVGNGVHRGRVDLVVASTAHRRGRLLVGTDPEYVGSLGHGIQL